MRRFYFLVFLALFSGLTTAQSVGGIYYFEDETETFSPCNSNKTYWATSTEKIHDQLRTEALSINKPIKGTLYIEATGKYIGKSSEINGYASDYDGDYQIEALHSIRAAKESDCRLSR